MKNISKVILFIIILIIIDLISGYALDLLYKRSKAGLCYHEQNIMNKTHQDILIFGSSRATYHYIPEILSDSLKLSVYNCGREGAGIFYHYGLLISTIARYNPKIIILDVDSQDLYPGGKGFSNLILKEHYPFYNKISNEFDSLLLVNWYDYYLLHSNLFQYNSKIFEIAKGNIINETHYFNGYRPKFGEWRQPFKTNEEEYKNISKDKVDMIISFIEKAKKNNILVILSISPLYKKEPVHFYYPLLEISKKYNIPLLTHNDYQRVLVDSMFFYDELHLNDRGARIYSSIVAKEVKSLIFNR